MANANCMMKKIVKTTALLMVMLLLMASVAQATTVNSFSALQSALAAAGMDSIDVSANISVTGLLTVNGTKSLRSSGGQLSRAASYNSNLFLVSGSSLSIDNLTIDGGSRPVSGALIRMRNNANLSLGNGAILQNNYSGGPGGAIFSVQSDVVMQNGSVIRNNKGSDGGGILADYGSVTLDGALIEDNEADSAGGGVYVQGNYIAGISASPDMVLQVVGNSRIQNNQSNDSGGGIYGEAAHVTLGDGALLTGNYDDYEGGGIYNQDGYVLIDGATIDNNSALKWGGGVSSRKGILQLDKGTISNNRTLSSGRTAMGSVYGGGGIWFEAMTNAGADFIMNGGNIVNNSADYGGGIQFVGGHMLATISGGRIENNTAGTLGGGIALLGRTTQKGDNQLTMKGGAIRFNNAPLGGGVYLGDCFYGGYLRPASELARVRFDFRAGSVVDNQASDKGGGIYLAKGYGDADATYIDQGRMELIMSPQAHLYDNLAANAGDDIFNDQASVQLRKLYNFLHPLAYTGWFEDDLGARYPGTISSTAGAVIVSASNSNEWKYDKLYSGPLLLPATASPSHGLKAIWGSPVIYHTVYFNAHGGTAVASVQVIHGDTVPYPTTPTRDGHSFWYWREPSGPGRWDFNANIVTSDLTLHAIWEAIDTSGLGGSPSSKPSLGGSIDSVDFGGGFLGVSSGRSEGDIAVAGDGAGSMGGTGTEGMIILPLGIVPGAYAEATAIPGAASTISPAPVESMGPSNMEDEFVDAATYEVFAS